jgi:hypothetical protein
MPVRGPCSRNGEANPNASKIGCRRHARARALFAQLHITNSSSARLGLTHSGTCVNICAVKRVHCVVELQRGRRGEGGWRVAVDGFPAYRAASKKVASRFAKSLRRLLARVKSDDEQLRMTSILAASASGMDEYDEPPCPGCGREGHLCRCYDMERAG